MPRDAPKEWRLGLYSILLFHWPWWVKVHRWRGHAQDVMEVPKERRFSGRWRRSCLACHVDEAYCWLTTIHYRCGHCEMAYYCSKECLNHDSPKHDAICVLLQATQMLFPPSHGKPDPSSSPLGQGAFDMDSIRLLLNVAAERYCHQLPSSVVQEVR